MLSTGLLVVHNALVGGEDNVAELTGWEDGVGEIFELVEGEVEAWGDNTALVEATVQVNNDLTGTGIVDDGEIVDVSLLLHETEDLDQDLGDWVEDNLNTRKVRNNSQRERTAVFTTQTIVLHDGQKALALQNASISPKGIPNRLRAEYSLHDVWRLVSSSG